MKSRGAKKRLGERVDGDPALRASLLDDARRRGVDLPEEAATWPGKRLVRAVLDRSEQAQVRTNPIRRDEAFVCVHCGADVAPHGRTARDHCPRCLRSLHVDVVPGDRAADCGGILDPVGVELRHGEWILSYRCRTCGFVHRNRAADDDDRAAVIALSTP